jgi:hypothetical protein
MTPTAKLVSLVPGQRLRATLSASTTLGEAADNDICLVGAGIVARHARVTLVDDRWRVEPIDGAVSLNDAPVTGPTFLTHLDVLTLGASTNLVFTVGAAAQPAAQPQTPVPAPPARPQPPAPPPIPPPQPPAPPPVARPPAPPPVPPPPPAAPTVVRPQAPPPLPPKPAAPRPPAPPAPRTPVPPARVDETVHMGALPQVPDALRQPSPAPAAAAAPLPPIELGSATMYLTGAASAGLSVPAAFVKPLPPPVPPPTPPKPPAPPPVPAAAPTPERPLAPPPTRTSPARQVRLVGESGTWTLSPGRNVVGRSPDCHVCLAARHISREHAVLVVAADGITIENAGARNGTTVNGTFLESRASLASGDRVAFAGFEFELRVEQVE